MARIAATPSAGIKKSALMRLANFYAYWLYKVGAENNHLWLRAGLNRRPELGLPGRPTARGRLRQGVCARTDRSELAKVLKRLGAGDMLMVVRLDRLARSTRHLVNILDAMGTSEAGFKSLGDAWAVPRRRRMAGCC
jgi:hypothetical protein